MNKSLRLGILSPIPSIYLGKIRFYHDFSSTYYDLLFPKKP